MKRITEQHELVELARELGVRPDWHEPDEQGITARFDGTDGDFDNAGFWPMDVSRALVPGGHVGYDPDRHGAPRRGEMAIVLYREVQDDRDEPGADSRRGPDIAAVNIATLFAWASVDVAALQARIEQLEAANAALRETLDRTRKEHAEFLGDLTADLNGITRRAP
jgi:hypothetical protein